MDSVYLKLSFNNESELDYMLNDLQFFLFEFGLSLSIGEEDVNSLEVTILKE